MQLLFCNTFSYESQGPSGNWAVIKFPCMIAVDEIRIVPLGVKVHSQLHDEQFVGQTSPTKFRIEFFSDDRSASLTTYEHVGSMEYAEGSPNRFHPSASLYSDKLLLKGWFSHITVAVYGGILSDIGSETPVVDKVIKTSLIIHEKPEGRSVYIRAVPDTPPLTKETPELKPLLGAFPSSSDPDFLLGRGSKNYPNTEENVGHRPDYQDMDDLDLEDVEPSYYDRRHQRDEVFNIDMGRGPRKPYMGDRMNYPMHQRGRKTLLPNVGGNIPFRGDISDRPPYRDKNRGFSSHQNPRAHSRHETIDNSDLSKREYKVKNERYQYNSRVPDKMESESGIGEQEEIRDLRQNLDRNRAERSSMEERDKEKGQQDWMEHEYEEISEEEIEEERVAAMRDMEEMVEDDILSTSGMLNFNPFLMEPSHLVHFNHPEMTDFEIACNSLLTQQQAHDVEKNPASKDVTELEKLVETARKILPLEVLENEASNIFLDAELGRDWVKALEDIIPLISNALPQMAVTQHEKYNECSSALIAWTFAALDNNLASSQSIGVNLRMLKCGINLSHKLCLTTQGIVACLSDSKLDTKLLALLETNYMASSIKIMIIHALDAYLSWPATINIYFECEGSENYGKLIELMLVNQAARVATALTRLVNKIQVFHSMWKLKSVTQVLVTEKIPNAEDEYEFEEDYLVEDAESDVVEEEIVLEEEEMMVMSSTSNDEDEELPVNVEAHYQDPEFRKVGKRLSGFEAAAQLPEKYQEVEVTPVNLRESSVIEDTTIPLEAVICMENAELTKKDVDDIVDALKLITNTLENVETTISQLPVRSFPLSSSLHQVSGKDAKTSMFRMLEYYQVLPSIQALLTLPIVSSVQDIYQSCYAFLDLLMSRQDGILHLVSNSKSLVYLARHLLCSARTFSSLALEDPGSSGYLGIKLAVHIQCMQCIDQLSSIPLENHDQENEEAIEILKVLFSLMYPTYGKYWVSKILSLEGNILPLIDCINSVKDEEVEKDQEEQKEKEKDDNKEKEGTTEKKSEIKKKSARKSAVSGYAMDILLGVLKMSPNVEYILIHSEVLKELVKMSINSHSLEEANEWIRPVINVTGEKDMIVEMVEYAKEGFEKLEWDTFMTSGPGLCTALRLLCHLLQAKHPYSVGGTSESKKMDPSAYRTALQVFSAGGIAVFMTGMEKLYNCFKYSCFGQHSLTSVFSFNFQNLIVSICENLLILIDHLLNVLLNTSDGKFRSDKLTKLLLGLYSGMYTLLRETDLTRLDIITELIVGILSRFMTSETKDKELEVDDWSKMFADLISGMQEHCEILIPGTILLSHMLPLPLPVVTQEEGLDNGLMSEILTFRKQWDSQINKNIETLSSLISMLCHTTCLPLLEALIPFIQQAIDLSANAATSLINVILNTSVVKLEKKEEIVGAEPVEIELRFNSQPLKILSEIIVQPSAKATLLEYILKDEKELFKKLWKSATDQAKEKNLSLLNAALAIANVLLDIDNCFVSNGDKNESSLPNSHICDIIHMAVEGLHTPSLYTVFASLNCLTLAVNAEDGFIQTRDALVKQVSTMYGVLDHISHCWGSDIHLSIETLFQFCLFMDRLSRTRDVRDSYLSPAELRSILKWNTESDTHPLLTLKSKLEEIDLTDDLFYQTLDEVTALCHSLKTSHSVSKKKSSKKSEKKDISKDNIKTLSLSEMFQLRPIWVLGDNDSLTFDGRLRILYGNTENSFTRAKLRGEKILRVDLVDMAEKFCTGFNLENSLKELTESAKTTDVDKIRMEAKAKRLKKLEAFSTRHGKTLTFIKRSHGLMAPNVRGRGRGRGGISSGRHYDVFRQRKQNTSRPPSMHVDDFMAADEKDNVINNPPPPTPPQFIPSRRTSRPFKRDFIPRGRGGRGINRITGPSRGGFNNFGVSGGNLNNPGFDKFRNKGARSQERIPRGRGRGRDSGRSSFSPREGFKGKPQHSWSISPRNFGGFASGGFRGGRGNKLMRVGRPLLPPPSPLNMVKWGGMPPPPRRGRGYGKPRGKHIRSFTR